MSEQIDKINKTEHSEEAEAAETREDLPEGPETEEAGAEGSDLEGSEEGPAEEAEAGETGEETGEKEAGEGETEETEAGEEGSEAEDAEAEEAEEEFPEEEPEDGPGADAEEDGSAPWEGNGASRLLRGKKRHRKHKKKHRLLRLAAVIAIIAALIAVGNLQYFAITEIPVIGNKSVSDEDILELSCIQEGSSIFFLNPWLTKSRIKKNRFVKDVKINRELPGTVELIITERDVVAQFIKWSKKGTVKRYAVTDETGMVIKKYKKKRNVTMVDDLTVTNAALGKKIRVKENGTYRKSMELIRTMRQGDLYFKEISIKGSLVTAYIYDDLVCKGRYRNLINSIQSGELKAVVYQLYQNDVSKGTINIGDNNYCSFTP